MWKEEDTEEDVHLKKYPLCSIVDQHPPPLSL